MLQPFGANGTQENSIQRQIPKCKPQYVETLKQDTGHLINRLISLVYSHWGNSSELTLFHLSVGSLFPGLQMYKPQRLLTQDFEAKFF